MPATALTFVKAHGVSTFIVVMLVSLFVYLFKAYKDPWTIYKDMVADLQAERQQNRQEIASLREKIKKLEAEIDELRSWQ